MSADSGPIQTIPRGLLGLLNLKNVGRLPDVLHGTVQPTIDLTAWWMNALAELDTNIHSNVLSSMGHTMMNFAVNPLVVPNNEVWWVNTYSVEVQLAAGAAELAENIAPLLLINTAGVPRWISLTDTSLTVRGDAAGVAGGVISARGFLAPPGSQLGFYIGRLATAGVGSFFAQVYKTAMII